MSPQAKRRPRTSRAGRQRCAVQAAVHATATAPVESEGGVLNASSLPELIHPVGWGEEQLVALLEHAQTGDHESSGPWLEFFPGESGIVLAAPHDGTCRPNKLPRRKSGVMVRDTGTKGLVAAVALEILRRGGRRPHVLVCRLVRNRLDPNRSRQDAASSEVARQVWDRYHQLLTWAREAAASIAPRNALFVDFHAQANWKYTGHDALELGTLCPSAEELRLGAPHLAALTARAAERAGVSPENPTEEDEERLAKELCSFFTMPRLAARAHLRSRACLPELLLGAGSLGTRLCHHGFEAIPSLAFPMPPPTVASSGSTSRSQSKEQTLGRSELKEQQGSEDEPQEQLEGGLSESALGPFFSGAASYTLRASKEVLDSLQVEFPVRLSKCPSAWAPLSQALLAALDELWQEHHGVELCAV